MNIDQALTLVKELGYDIQVSKGSHGWWEGHIYQTPHETPLLTHPDLHVTQQLAYEATISFFIKTQEDKLKAIKESLL